MTAHKLSAYNTTNQDVPDALSPAKRRRTDDCSPENEKRPRQHKGFSSSSFNLNFYPNQLNSGPPSGLNAIGSPQNQ